MAKFFGKKQVLLGTLVVALGVAVYLNYYFAQNPSVFLESNTPQTVTSTTEDKKLGEAINVNSSNPASKEDYFTEARKNREASRAEATELVKDILGDVKATDEQKNQASAQVIAIAKAMDQESKLENLIKAKGFAECVVYIEGEKCSIVVQSDGLSVQEAAQISQIVTAQSNILAQNINIVPIN